MSEATKQPTPRPWKLGKQQNYYIDMYAPNIRTICTFSSASATDVDWLTNAEFIVRACNAHDELLQLVKDLGAFVPTERREAHTSQWVTELARRRDAAISRATPPATEAASEKEKAL